MAISQWVSHDYKHCFGTYTFIKLVKADITLFFKLRTGV